MGMRVKLPLSTVSFLVVGLALTFGVRAGYTLITHPDPDFALNVDRWGTIARNIVEGHGYSYPYWHDPSAPNEPSARRGPVPVLLYAGLFTVFGYHVAPVLVTLWLFDCLTGLLIFLLGRHLFHSDRVGLIALFAWAVYLPEVSFSNQARSEQISALLLAATLWVVVMVGARPTWKTGLAAGVLLGLAVMTLPTLIFLPLIVAAVWFLAFRHVRAGLVLLAVFALVQVPWVVRNALVFHEWIPTTSSLGINLLVDHAHLDQPNYVPQLDGPGGDEHQADLLTLQILARDGKSAVGLGPAALDSVRIKESLRLIAAHPDRYLVLCVLRFGRLWFNVGYGYPPSWASLGTAAINLVLLVLALLQVAGAGRRRGLVLALLPVYFTLIYCAMHSQVRYLLPAMPAVLLLASAFVVVTVERRIAAGRRSASTVLAGPAY